MTTILRKAKQHYYINILNDVKNNSKKLWTHLNSIIKPNSINNCPVDCEKLNEFLLMFLNKCRFDLTVIRVQLNIILLANLSF